MAALPDGWVGVSDRILSGLVNSFAPSKGALAALDARVATEFQALVAKTLVTKVDALPTHAEFQALVTKVDSLPTQAQFQTLATKVDTVLNRFDALAATFAPAVTAQGYNEKTRLKNRLRSAKGIPLLPLMDQHGALVPIRTAKALRTTIARIDVWWNRFDLDHHVEGPEYERLSAEEQREIKQRILSDYIGTSF